MYLPRCLHRVWFQQHHLVPLKQSHKHILHCKEPLWEGSSKKFEFKWRAADDNSQDPLDSSVSMKKDSF